VVRHHAPELIEYFWRRKLGWQNRADWQISANPEKNSTVFAIPSAHVQAYFGDNDLGRLFFNAGDLGQIDSTDLVQPRSSAGFGWTYDQKPGAVLFATWLQESRLLALFT
jgi:hypothetical protein